MKLRQSFHVFMGCIFSHQVAIKTGELLVIPFIKWAYFSYYSCGQHLCFVWVSVLTPQFLQTHSIIFASWKSSYTAGFLVLRSENTPKIAVVQLYFITLLPLFSPPGGPRDQFFVVCLFFDILNQGNFQDAKSA